MTPEEELIRRYFAARLPASRPRGKLFWHRLFKPAAPKKCSKSGQFFRTNAHRMPIFPATAFYRQLRPVDMRYSSA